MPVPPRRHGPAGIVQPGGPRTTGRRAPARRRAAGPLDADRPPASPVLSSRRRGPIRAAARGEAFWTTRGAGGRVVTDREAQRGDRGAEAPGQGIDTALVEEALRGRLEAFNQLVTRHQDHLFALVYRLVPDRDQAADAVQEAFFSAYRNLESFRGGSVRSWLGRIAINAAMDMQRTRRRRPVQPYPEFEDDSWQPPAETGGRAGEPGSRRRAFEGPRPGAGRAAVRAAQLHRPVRRGRLRLRRDRRRSCGFRVGTVKSRIHRGRLALRNALAPHRELFRG